MMVVGLGNVGSDYQGTRHNVGIEVVDLLVRRGSSELGRAPSRVRGRLAQIGVGEHRVLYLVPTTMMNLSGQAVRNALDYFKVVPDDVLVIHDDIDLAFGRLRLQVAGGTGGHNGIRSVESALGTSEFSRLKVGVGRPPGSQDPADYVLRPFTKKERPEVDVQIQDAADVVEMWLTDRDRAQEMAAHRGTDV